MEEKYIDGETPIIINIPKETVKLRITATIYDGEKMHECEMMLNLPEINDARVKGEEWEDENITYSLTEKGEEYLREKYGGN